MIKLKKTKRGFTLIEVLIVMAIIAMLAAIVIVAINPARQFAQARNTQRWSGVNSILNAVTQKMIDNNGLWATSTDCEDLPNSTSTEITASGGVDICNCLVPTYIVAMPYDPTFGSYTSCSNYDTEITIYEDGTTGRITVEAPQAELGETISVTR